MEQKRKDFDKHYQDLMNPDLEHLDPNDPDFVMQLVHTSAPLSAHLIEMTDAFAKYPDVVRAIALLGASIGMCKAETQMDRNSFLKLAAGMWEGMTIKTTNVSQQ